MVDELEDVLAQEGAYKLTDYGGEAFQVWKRYWKDGMLVTHCIGVYLNKKEAWSEYNRLVSQAKKGDSDG